MPLFRNDDVSPETDVESFRHFCSIFHQYGYLQLHGVTPYGHTHDRVQENGVCKVYPGDEPIVEMSPEKVMALSQGSYIGDNAPLVRFLNAIPDPIALHGPYHYDFTRLDEGGQRSAIAEGLRLLGLLFPKKPVRDFIPPFNRYNEATERICREFGLTLHTDAGVHMEAMIHYGNRCQLQADEEYRYHHHRFYEGSPFTHYELSLRALYRFFMETAPQRPILSREVYANCIQQSGAQPWYGYAYKNFEKLEQCHAPYRWIRENVERHERIVETGCGAGGVLHMLWHEGFCNLHGYDLDGKAVAAGRAISKAARSSISFMEHDCTKPMGQQPFHVILGMNWIYLLEGFGLTDFVATHLPSLKNDGYLIFDTIDASFNDHPLSMYFTQDWKKEDGQRRPSEYHERFAADEVVRLMQTFSLSHVHTYAVEYTIPRNVHVFQKKA